MKHTTDMTQSKTTPNTVVYVAEMLPNALSSPLIKTLYLTKTQLPTPFPRHIAVTVEARSDLGGA